MGNGCQVIVRESGPDDLSRGQRVGLIVLLLAFVAFGGIVVLRGALLKKRMTDLAVFLRAAWAVKSGADLYQITDDKGLPYNYPPLLAILLVPLADPPRDAAAAAAMPFAVNVGLWYGLSVLILAAGLHCLAAALERNSERPSGSREGCPARRWWALRVIPLVVCLPPICQALSLGQVNVLWLALMCGMAVAVVRRQSLRAGLWLAGAICLKVLPIFLIVYPLWRRDWRCLSGCAWGLFLGLVVIPVLALGPSRTWAYTREWSEVMLMPAFGMGNDHSRDQDLLGINNTHNQALMPVIHKTLHLDRRTRPATASTGVRLAHWLIGGTLTLITLLAAGWRRRMSGLEQVLFLGALNVNMIVLSPAGHAHYLTLLALLVAVLMASRWVAGSQARLGPFLTFLFICNPIAAGLPLLPGMQVLHDLGLPMYFALAFWLAAVRRLWTGVAFELPKALVGEPVEFKQPDLRLAA
jgi:hypothetical protein